jgi:hypothetical protein
MTIRTAPLLAAAALLASGCFAQLEEKSLVIRRPLGYTIPGATSAVSLDLPDVVFDVGDITIDGSSKDSQLTIKTATLILPGGASATFSGITDGVLEVTAPNDPSLPAVALTYDKARDGPAGTTLVMSGNPDANVLAYLQQKTLAMHIKLNGQAPIEAWTADLAIDFYLLGKIRFP